MAEKPRVIKIRGNRDPALPIEEWAKGLSRAFSRRKSSSSKSQRVESLAPISDDFTGRPYGYTATISSPTSTSFSTSSRAVTPNKAPNQPIEDWVNTLPKHKLGIQPRNPLRLSIHERPSTSTSTSRSFSTTSDAPSSSSSSPLDSASIPTDWSSDFERELPALNPYHDLRLKALADTSSSIQEIEEIEEPEALDEVAPLALKTTSQEKTDQTSASMGLKPISLRSIFFPGSNESRERHITLSDDSSEAASRLRSISAASSVESFTTAYDGSDCAIEDDLSNEDLNKEENNDTGIDEDYTPKEDVDEEDEAFAIAAQEFLFEAKEAQEHVYELQHSDQESDMSVHVDSDPGSLEDILAQVALSSPYASSDSDASSESDKQEELQLEAGDDMSNETSSERHASIPDIDSTGSPISISSEPILERQGVRPGRHYKMINGIIVQYDPWRAPSQFDTVSSSPSSEGIDTPLSDRNFQRSGTFLRNGNRWTYGETRVGVAA